MTPNLLSLIAKPADVDAMLLSARKNFVGKLVPIGDLDDYKAQSSMEYTSVYAVLLITNKHVDENGDMDFLVADYGGKSTLVKNHLLKPAGFLIPEIALQDLTTGMNKDRSVNSDNSCRIDTLQLTRALVQAGRYYTSEMFDTDLFQEVLGNDNNEITVRVPNATGPLNHVGMAQLLLSVKVSATTLNEIVHRLNHDPQKHKDVTFKTVSLNKVDYPETAVTLN